MEKTQHILNLERNLERSPEFGKKQIAIRNGECSAECRYKPGKGRIGIETGIKIRIEIGIKIGIKIGRKNG